MTDTRSTRELCSAGTNPKTSALAAGDQHRETDDEAVDADIEEDALAARRATRRSRRAAGSRAARAGRRGPRRARRGPGSRRSADGRSASASRRAPAARRFRRVATRRAPARAPRCWRTRSVRTSRPIAVRTISVGSRIDRRAARRLPERHDPQPLRGIGERPIARQRRPRARRSARRRCASVVPGRR